MIFDSESMSNLRAKYADAPDYGVPRVIFLDRSPKLSSEREYLERLVQSAPKEAQRGWVARLVSTDPGQHLGAWFEIMLYGWLMEIGRVEVEPWLEGSRPDFVLHVAGQEIVVESRACLVGDVERQQGVRDAEVLARLNSIPLSYVVIIEKLAIDKDADVDTMMESVDTWPLTRPLTPFHYQDSQGNKVQLAAQEYPTLETVATIGPARTAWISPEPLKSPLREKAGQHRGLRRAGYPYVLALLLESWKYSAEEVAEAWFGGTRVTVDVQTNQPVEQGLDRTGLHFFGSEVRHRTVSGTLVFRADLNKAIGRRELRPWYIQNPFAHTHVGPSLFPAESRYVLVEEKAGHPAMVWKPDSQEGSQQNRRAD